MQVINFLIIIGKLYEIYLFYKIQYRVLDNALLILTCSQLCLVDLRE